MERDFYTERRSSVTGDFCWTLDKLANAICKGMCCSDCPLYGKLPGEKGDWKDVVDENDCTKTRYYLETYKRLWNFYLLHKNYYYKNLIKVAEEETGRKLFNKNLEERAERICTIQDMQKFMCELYNKKIVNDIPEYAKSW